MDDEDDPTEYEAIHSTYEDNFVYRNDENYIVSLQSIIDPVLRQAWIPGSWDILAGQFFSELGSGAACQKLQSVCLRILAAAMDVD